MKSDRRETLLLIVIILVLSLGVGYAYITTTLTISGTADVDSSNWNVYLNNVQVSTGSISGSQVTQAPTINTNKNGITFHINLKEPGEYYEFTVDVKNDGSLDAMIGEVRKTINGSTTVPPYLKYAVTYENGAEIEENQILRSNTKETYKVRVEYKTVLEEDDLPSTNRSLNLGIEIDHIQADSNAKEITRTVYSQPSYPYEVTLGEPFPDEIEYFNTEEEIVDDILTNYKGRVFVKNLISGDIVVENQICLMFDPDIYCITGGENTIAYNTGKAELNRIFGEENCWEEAYDLGLQYLCQVRINSFTRSGIVEDTYLSLMYDEFGCSLYDNKAAC